MFSDSLYNVYSIRFSNVLCNVFSSVYCPDVQLYKYSDQQGSGQGKISAVQEHFSEVQYILYFAMQRWTL